MAGNGSIALDAQPGMRGDAGTHQGWVLNPQFAAKALRPLFQDSHVVIMKHVRYKTGIRATTVWAAANAANIRVRFSRSASSQKNAKILWSTSYVPPTQEGRLRYCHPTTKILWSTSYVPSAPDSTSRLRNNSFLKHWVIAEFTACGLTENPERSVTFLPILGLNQETCVSAYGKVGLWHFVTVSGALMGNPSVFPVSVCELSIRVVNLTIRKSTSSNDLFFDRE
jgi:hypothetical protein